MSLTRFLQRHEPIAETWPDWGQIHLREHTYLSGQLPPDDVVSSVRAILFRGKEVMVITDYNGEPYIIPGGRREPRESLKMALRRELLEETGWQIGGTAVLGFIHFHHLTPKPDGYPYPYPDFVQVVYTAIAHSYDAAAITPDPYVASSRFCPIEEVLTLNLSGGQKALIQAAMSHRSGKG